MNHLRRRLLCAWMLGVSMGLWAFAQGPKSGPQVLTFFSDVDDTDQPYAVYVPKGFNPAKKYPLVVSLHGAGSNHRLNLRRVFGLSNLPGETDVEATRYFPEWADVDFFVASPLARGTMGYQGIAEQDVYDVLADVERRFPIDEDRVYLTGLSMGGGGAIWLGLTRPDVWAAIAPVCPAPPAEAETLAPNALNIPVHFFQGGADTTVRPEGTRTWVKRLQDLGTNVEYTEYPGVHHNSWENAYKDEAIFTWFAPFRRNRFPDRVRFVTTRYKYDSAYWIRIDELTAGTPASVDARFTAANRVEITTSGLGAFTLRLAGHPRFSADRALDVAVDGTTVRTQVAEAVPFAMIEGRWAEMRYEPPAGGKKRGAEGPMNEVVAGRHIYVYGTGGNPSREELQARREQASQAADWSRGRSSPLLVFPRVLADAQVRPSDLESSNLVLFGTTETNALIGKFGPRLPIHLTDTSGSSGLVYVFPIDGRYVLISSGRPWWPAATSAAAPRPALPAASGTPLVRRSFSFMPGPAGALGNFQDFALFKDSPENVIAEGRFEKNWRLTEADAAKLKASGTVMVIDR
jgi:poly(3-hydroxybutyrate) depolymerase